MNVVSNECGLKWTWSQMNVVSNEWSRMNVVSNECGLKWKSLKWMWSQMNTSQMNGVSNERSLKWSGHKWIGLKWTWFQMSWSQMNVVSNEWSQLNGLNWIGPNSHGTGEAGPRLFLGGSFRSGGCRCRWGKCGDLLLCPPTPHCIGDPPTVLHVCCCCQMNWWVVVRRAHMGVSTWGAVRLHSMDGWVLSGAGVQAPYYSFLETAWLNCNEAQQVGCLRGLEGCPLVQGEGIQSQFPRRRWW